VAPADRSRIVVATSITRKPIVAVPIDSSLVCQMPASRSWEDVAVVVDRSLRSGYRTRLT
jgi:hypothetical protein